ncbi:MAG: copper resistance D family protein [Acidiferrobacterales bacterium]
MHVHPLYIGFTALDVLAVVGVLGLLACWFGVLPRAPAGQIDTAISRLLGMAIALLTISSVGILVARTLEMEGGRWAGLLPALPVVLKVTHYGHIWRFRVPELVVLWYGWFKMEQHHRRAWPVWLMMAAAAAIALTRSETGHPADNGDFTLAVWVDWAHLLAGSVWVGSLFGMSLAVFPQLLARVQKPPLLAAEIFERLSRIAGFALGAVLLTGVYTAWHELGSWNELWNSQYGRILTVKLLFVAGMIALGARNRYGHLPCLQRLAGRAVRRSLLPRPFGATRDKDRITRPAEESAIRSCFRTVRFEGLLGLAVIVTASALLHSMPVSNMPRTPSTRMSRPVSLTLAGSVAPQTPGVRPRLSGAPGRS